MRGNNSSRWSFFGHLAIAVVFVVYFLLGCSKGERIAGGGQSSETTNTISGIVNLEEGGGAEGMVVTLYPKNFNPVEESISDGMRTVTDEKGGFTFTLPKAGEYNIHAVNIENRKTSIIPGLRIDEKLDSSILAPEMVLEKPAIVSLYIEELGLEKEGYVYVPGTGLSKELSEADIETGLVQIGDIPPAEYGEVIYHSPEDKLENILATPISIESEGALSIGPYQHFPSKLKVIVNTSSTGMDIEKDVYDFPLLVKLTRENASDILDNGQEAIQSIRFAKSNEVDVLPFEIESWNSSSANIWVKLDTLFAQSEDQYFYLYHSKDGADSKSSGSGVFISDNDFVGVWHLNETPSTEEDAIIDASENLNHVTLDKFSADFQSNGLIGNGFNMNDENMVSKKSYSNPTDITISTWIKSFSNDKGGILMGFGKQNTLTVGPRDRLLYMGDDGRLHFGIYPSLEDSISPTDTNFFQGVGVTILISSEESYNDQKWHHVAARFSEAGMFLFVDGELVAQREDANKADDFTGKWLMGYEGILESWPFSSDTGSIWGTLDEIRVSHTTRSDAWIKLCYENQKEDGIGVSISE